MLMNGQGCFTANFEFDCKIDKDLVKGAFAVGLQLFQVMPVVHVQAALNSFPVP